MEKEELLNKIDEIFKELEEEIKLKNLKIKANVTDAYFTEQYIIKLRDDYFENEGRRNMLNKVRNKIHELKKEE